MQTKGKHQCYNKSTHGVSKLNQTFLNYTYREWDAVDKKIKVQQERCYALLVIGLKRGHFIEDKRELITLFHCCLLSTSLFEMLSIESNELKTLLQIPTFEIDSVLLPLGKDIMVCNLW